jgi:hypothetical protein
VTPPVHSSDSDAEGIARAIRERCLHEDGAVGLALLDLLLADARKLLDDDGSAHGSFGLPPGAWKVLVRVMEEWHNWGEQSLEQYRRIRDLLDRQARGGRTRKEEGQRLRELIRQMADVGCDARRIQENLRRDHQIAVTLKTVRNNLTRIRRHRDVPG